MVFILSALCLKMGRTQDVLGFFWLTWYEAITYGFKMKDFWGLFFTYLYIFIWIHNFYNEEYMMNLALNLPGFLCLKYVSSKQQNPVWQSSFTWSA